VNEKTKRVGVNANPSFVAFEQRRNAADQLPQAVLTRAASPGM
jgi:hypothetical protein